MVYCTPRCQGCPHKPREDSQLHGLRARRTCGCCHTEPASPTRGDCPQKPELFSRLPTAAAGPPPVSSREALLKERPRGFSQRRGAALEPGLRGLSSGVPASCFSRICFSAFYWGGGEEFLGCPVGANNNTGWPVKCEFQVNSK